MRILLFPSSYPPVVGGLQTVAHNLARRFKEIGHEVRVCTNRYPVSLPKSETIEGVHVDRLLLLKPQLDYLRRERPDLLLASFYFYPEGRWRLKKLFAMLQPEIVNIHFPDAQIPYVQMLRRQFKFRLVVSLHGWEVEHQFVSNGNSNGRSPRGQRLRSLLREADAVTACSNDLLSKACHLEPTIEPKSFVVHNGVDLKSFQNGTGYEHPRPYLFSYGRLTFKKGFDLLLSAFSQAARHYPDIDLIIAGEGTESQNLIELARKLGISERVLFFGVADQTQIAKLLNGCLFLIVPSRVEPFGIVALEGMAAGKAVLATRVGGLPEFLDTSANKLVNPSADDLAAGIGEWLSSQDLVSALGSHNRLTAAQYGWNRTAEGYLDAYGLLHQKPEQDRRD